MNGLLLFQLRRVGRNRQYLFFTVLLPALFTIFFTEVLGGRLAAGQYQDVAGGRVVADGSSATVKSAVAGRTVRFTCPGARTGLDTLAGVTSVGHLGDLVELATTDAEATLRALLTRYDRLPDLEVRGATLEQAFLQLTARPEGATR